MARILFIATRAEISSPIDGGTILPGDNSGLFPRRLSLCSKAITPMSVFPSAAHHGDVRPDLRRSGPSPATIRRDPPRFLRLSLHSSSSTDLRFRRPIRSPRRGSTSSSSIDHSISGID
ncbi:beta-galactosidase precursor [Iris pallida]|uniref:Beta-galactosidase n=1 Tax=Iris pallida TaxID=29817 RepID=A0AAX6HY12_IRIPA|nr:beta-galactosidase precursor [Iris pallida]KAJ6850127.1 beta-galactosidase precursor [Iris pallida]